MAIDFSVIICTYNRSANLKAALSSLAQMNLPGALQWEVIVIDNNSTDDTKKVVAEFARSALVVKYIFEPVQGLSHARNRGVRESNGAVLSFIDDDVVVAPDWLLEVRNAFHQYQVACVGGRVPLRKNLITPKWWHEDYDNAIGACDKGDEIIVADAEYLGLIGIGANLSFKRGAFEKHGDFRTDLGRIGASLLMGEEAEFCNRLKTNGELLIYYPKAVVYQCPDIHRMTKRYVQRWFFRIGEWLYLQDQLLKVNAERQVKLILGVPRWMYKVAARNGLSLLYLYLRARPKDAFHEVVQFTTFLGYAYGSVKHGIIGKRKLLSQSLTSR
ncbi:MAG: glycosyltransferase [Nitrospiraceae bacterium]